MIILHNSQDEYSRAFVEAFGDGHYVIDWYTEFDEWLAAGGTDKVAGFPALIIEKPELVLEATTAADGTPVPERTVPAHQFAICLPKQGGPGVAPSMVDLGQHIKRFNDRSKASKNKPGNINIHQHPVALPEKFRKTKAALVRENEVRTGRAPKA